MADEPMDRRPRLLAPPGACDCHIHIFGPRARFPLAAELAYTPAEAPVEAYRELQCRLGLSRTVVVQPSAYGTDNACTLDAIARLQPYACGIAVVDPYVSEAELERLHNAGIRGLRFSLVVKNALRPEHLELMASRIQPLGWHIQFRSTDRDLPELASKLQRPSRGRVPRPPGGHPSGSAPHPRGLAGPVPLARRRTLLGQAFRALSAFRDAGPGLCGLCPPSLRACKGGPREAPLGNQLASPAGGGQA